MATNDFVPFCGTDTGTNLLTQSAYLADPQLAIGNQTGTARSKLVNKALRQATYIASSLAQYLANVTGNDVLDDATQSEVLTTLSKALTTPLNPYAAIYQITSSGSSTITAPVNFNSSVSDHYSLVTTGGAWKLTAPFNCFLLISGQIVNSTSSDIQYYLNGSAGPVIGSIDGAGKLGQFSSIIKLSSGDYIDIRLDGNGTYSNGNFYANIIGRF